LTDNISIFSSNILNINDNKPFELFRNEFLMCSGIINTSEFENLRINLSSDEHNITKKNLNKIWEMKDFEYI
jgi:hypothetical protein